MHLYFFLSWEKGSIPGNAAAIVEFRQKLRQRDSVAEVDLMVCRWDDVWHRGCICVCFCFWVITKVLIYHWIRIYTFTGKCQYSRSRVGVIEPISSVPLYSEFFSIVKTHVRYLISCLYLPGSASAQLRWYLSICMWIKESNSYFCKIENFAYGEINKRSFSNPHSWGHSAYNDTLNACRIGTEGCLGTE